MANAKFRVVDEIYIFVVDIFFYLELFNVSNICFLSYHILRFKF